MAFVSLVLCGSASASDFERNVLLGAGLGAGVGALIGSATGPGGAAVGAAIGGVSGGVIVFLIRPDGCYIQNRRGELWQVPCHGRTVRNASACFIGGELRGLRQVPARPDCRFFSKYQPAPCLPVPSALSGARPALLLTR